jgi:hypothetical protein
MSPIQMLLKTDSSNSLSIRRVLAGRNEAHFLPLHRDWIHSTSRNGWAEYAGRIYHDNRQTNTLIFRIEPSLKNALRIAAERKTPVDC